MKNLRIGKKLLISYAVILLLFITGMTISIVYLFHFSSQIETFNDTAFTVKGSSDIMNANFEAMQKNVFRSISTDNPAITQESIENVRSINTELKKQLAIIETTFTGDQEIIVRLKNAFDELSPMREHVLELAAQNKNSEAAAYMEENNIPVIKKAQNELTTLIALANKQAEDLNKDLGDAQMRAAAFLTVLTLASLAVSLSFAAYIMKGVTKPISELELAAANLVDGKLNDISISYTSKDELGHLAESMRNLSSSMIAIIRDETGALIEMSNGNFNIRSTEEAKYVGEYLPLFKAIGNISKNLSAALLQINQASEQVASGAEQMSSGAQTLSSGASEQAASVEELASTVNEISEQVGQNANFAKQANRKALAVGDEARDSNERMKDMLTAMSDINGNSTEIRMIIKTIEDIAFQTNLLALNAAVEAARAGSAGRGFAVVAEEVRSLSVKSAEASKNTAELIERSLRSVKNGTALAEETAKSLSSVASGVKEVVSALSQISASSSEQAGSIEEIARSVDQISNVIQINSATAEESAAASEELSAQAQVLMDLVDQFQLRPQNR